MRVSAQPKRAGALAPPALGLSAPVALAFDAFTDTLDPRTIQVGVRDTFCPTNPRGRL